MVVYAVYCRYIDEELECVFLSKERADEYEKEKSRTYMLSGGMFKVWYVRELHVIE